jgi:membrane protein implicated in regulation of membrane protease activity
MALTVAQMGVPGAAELFVIVVMFLLFLAVPVVLILLLVRLLRRSPEEERIRELEKEVAELRGRVEERNGETGNEP